MIVFRKMKPFKLYIEYYMGINALSLHIIETGCKTINKEGATILIPNPNPHSFPNPPFPQNISSN